jgi:hypothetical protein
VLENTQNKNMEDGKPISGSFVFPQLLCPSYLLTQYFLFQIKRGIGLLSSFVEMQCIHHTIHPFNVCNSVTFIIFMIFCKH